MSNSKDRYTHPVPFMKVKSELGSESVHYAALCETIPEGFEHLAEQELNETVENKLKGIRKLKEFLKKENTTCSSDDLLIMVLRCCKYDIKKSKTKLKQFLKSRKETIDILSKTDLKTIEAVIDDIMFGVLPYRDKSGSIIMFSRPNLNFDLYNLEQISACIVACLMFLLSFPMTSICGVSYIGEAKGYSPYGIFCILKNATHFVINNVHAIPMRYRRSDALNENIFIRLFVKSILPFLPKKISKRIFFHGSNLQGLHKVYPPVLLPNDFGGTLGPISNEFYRERLLNFIKDLRAEHQQIIP